MPFADLKDVRLRYELEGSDASPVLVLSNSLGVSLEMWDSQMTAFAKHFRVLRYDTRGLGGSSVPVGPYLVDQLGGDVLNLLDSLEIKEALFCGVSMGGQIGQWLGIHAPDRIRRIVVASTAAKIGTDESWNARIATVQSEGLAPVIPGTVERWFTADFRARSFGSVAIVENMLRSVSPEGYAANCAAVRDADFRDELHRIKAPTLVISGKHDVSTTIDDGRFLADEIPHAHFVELDAAHLCNVEAVDAFNEAATEFLTI
ncbi:3-oxoadipate enol-lactonase [Acidicapsa dinghuensis]|uniref:3-oxoadipate enol-lactonase n=1 Tax=Acidicapsa dinghuensis TaxID=2218256 RepID=A0ABW1EDZ5_9BACT|nr:3-oxoadipate enol-lactonase [Acidicapsa dinghuensis]